MSAPDDINKLLLQNIQDNIRRIESKADKLTENSVTKDDFNRFQDLIEKRFGNFLDTSDEMKERQKSQDDLLVDHAAKILANSTFIQNVASATKWFIRVTVVAALRIGSIHFTVVSFEH